MSNNGCKKVGAEDRLLYCYPSSFSTINDFELYLEDIASVANISPKLIQEARAAFLKKIYEKEKSTTITSITCTPQRIFNTASLKYWLFDIVVMTIIALGLLSFVEESPKIEPIKYEYIPSPKTEAIKHESLQTTDLSEDNHNCSPCTPIKTKLFKVYDMVDVFDPNIHHPFSIPWEIKQIYSGDKDGSIRFDLQRHVAGRESLLVLENVNAETIVQSKPFEANTKAMCEFYLEIYPCTVIDLEDPNIPGGGLYSVVFKHSDGKEHFTYRPFYNIWRITDLAPENYTPPEILKHPLVD
jgi:hypothetical protein